VNLTSNDCPFEVHQDAMINELPVAETQHRNQLVGNQESKQDFNGRCSACHDLNRDPFRGDGFPLHYVSEEYRCSVKSMGADKVQLK